MCEVYKAFPLRFNQKLSSEGTITEVAGYAVSAGALFNNGFYVLFKVSTKLFFFKLNIYIALPNV